MHLGYWYSLVLETGGVCQRTPQVRPCRLCASIIDMDVVYAGIAGANTSTCWRNLCQTPPIPKTSDMVHAKG